MSTLLAYLQQADPAIHKCKLATNLKIEDCSERALVGVENWSEFNFHTIDDLYGHLLDKTVDRGSAMTIHSPTSSINHLRDLEQVIATDVIPQVNNALGLAYHAPSIVQAQTHAEQLWSSPFIMRGPVPHIGNGREVPGAWPYAEPTWSCTREHGIGSPSEQRGSTTCGNLLPGISILSSLWSLEAFVENPTKRGVPEPIEDLLNYVEDISKARYGFVISDEGLLVIRFQSRILEHTNGIRSAAPGAYTPQHPPKSLQCRFVPWGRTEGITVKLALWFLAMLASAPADCSIKSEYPKMNSWITDPGRPYPQRQLSTGIEKRLRGSSAFSFVTAGSATTKETAAPYGVAKEDRRRCTCVVSMFVYTVAPAALWLFGLLVFWVAIKWPGHILNVLNAGERDGIYVCDETDEVSDSGSVVHETYEFRGSRCPTIPDWLSEAAAGEWRVKEDLNRAIYFENALTRSRAYWEEVNHHHGPVTYKHVEHKYPSTTKRPEGTFGLSLLGPGLLTKLSMYYRTLRPLFGND